MEEAQLIPPPIYFATDYPSLIGQLESGELINLDGGKIELNVNDRVRWVLGKPIIESGRQSYSIQFYKGEYSPWNEWFSTHEDIRFKVGGIWFKLNLTCFDIYNTWLYRGESCT